MKILIALFVFLAPVVVEGQDPTTHPPQAAPPCVNCDVPDIVPEWVPQFVTTKDGQLLPQLQPYPVDTLQHWHDQAASNFANCYEHYKACWWNRYSEQLQCGLQ